jgi:hypothetical protein
MLTIASGAKDSTVRSTAAAARAGPAPFATSSSSCSPSFARRVQSTG